MPKRSRIFESSLFDDTGPENEKKVWMTVFSIKENSRWQIHKSKKTQCRVKIINYIQNNYSNKMKIKMLGFKNAFLL